MIITERHHLTLVYRQLIEELLVIVRFTKSGKPEADIAGAR